ncbi:hypothetical protein L2E82_26477 [Cichorium intybus]|uniref:Uncharacterized protein n=1 Tax=Cichorium intybus TaxID=13427 RepID=A0ACB9CQL5_CICIN|nr:hypothetical protein L2E82_26477 [Cichorium intybus]
MTLLCCNLKLVYLQQNQGSASFDFVYSNDKGGYVEGHAKDCNVTGRSETQSGDGDRDSGEQWLCGCKQRVVVVRQEGSSNGGETPLEAVAPSVRRCCTRNGCDRRRWWRILEQRRSEECQDLSDRCNAFGAGFLTPVVAGEGKHAGRRWSKFEQE